MSVALLPCGADDRAALEAAAMDAVLTFSDDEHAVAPGGALAPGKRLWRLQLDGQQGAIRRSRGCRRFE